MTDSHDYEKVLDSLAELGREMASAFSRDPVERPPADAETFTTPDSDAASVERNQKSDKASVRRAKRGRRRGRKEGSLFLRKDGRWEGRIDLGFRNGRRHRKSFFGHSQEEVRLKLVEATRARDAGLPVPSGKDMVAIYLRGWLQDVKPSVKPRTWESYELYIRRHAAPSFEHLRLTALRPGHIRALLDRKLKEGLSP